MAAHTRATWPISPSVRTLLSVFAVSLLLGSRALGADELPEYRLKAAILYNFVQFTEWPSEVGPALDLCVVGQDPFGQEIDALQDKPAGVRHLAVHRKTESESLKGCSIVFIVPASMGSLARFISDIHDGAVLTVADSPGATRRGVILNMSINQGKVAFEVNLKAAKAARLKLSSKVLRLATDVIE